jgi:hypothetical protein
MSACRMPGPGEPSPPTYSDLEATIRRLAAEVAAARAEVDTLAQMVAETHKASFDALSGGGAQCVWCLAWSGDGQDAIVHEADCHYALRLAARPSSGEGREAE